MEHRPNRVESLRDEGQEIDSLNYVTPRSTSPNSIPTIVALLITGFYAIGLFVNGFQVKYEGPDNDSTYFTSLAIFAGLLVALGLQATQNHRILEEELSGKDYGDLPKSNRSTVHFHILANSLSVLFIIVLSDLSYWMLIPKPADSVNLYVAGTKIVTIEDPPIVFLVGNINYVWLLPLVAFAFYMVLTLKGIELIGEDNVTRVRQQRIEHLSRPGEKNLRRANRALREEMNRYSERVTGSDRKLNTYLRRPILAIVGFYLVEGILVLCFWLLSEGLSRTTVWPYLPELQFACKALLMFIIAFVTAPFALARGYGRFRVFTRCESWSKLRSLGYSLYFNIGEFIFSVWWIGLCLVVLLSGEGLALRHYVIAAITFIFVLLLTCIFSVKCLSRKIEC